MVATPSSFESLPAAPMTALKQTKRWPARKGRWVLSVIAVAFLAACGGKDDSVARSDSAGFADAALHAAADANSGRAKRLANDAASVNAEVLLRWAEFKFPDLFPPGAATVYPSVLYEGRTYYAREYRGAWGSRYLGVASSGEVHGLGDWTGNVLQRYGVVADWTGQVVADRCRFDAGACAAVAVAKPKVVMGGTSFEQAALALKSDGSLVGWGPPGLLLGSAALIQGTSTRPVVLPVPVVDMAVGEFGSLAVGTDGGLYGWGRANAGEMGNFPPGTTLSVPTRIVGVDNLVEVLPGGSNRSVLLQRDGTVWTWPGEAALPTGPGVSNRYSPGQAMQPAPVARLLPDRNTQYMGNSESAPAGASQVALALLRDGRAARVSVGLTTAGTRFVYPLSINPVQGWTDLSDFDCSSSHCLGLKSDGTVFAKGTNDRGQLGQGHTRSLDTAQFFSVPGLSRIVDVAVYDTTSYAVDADGRVWEWGDRQLAAAQASPSAEMGTPAIVSGLTSIARIDSQSFMIATDRAGRVFSWPLSLDRWAVGDRTRFTTPVQAQGVVLGN
jgi:hypothetical protein